MSTRNLPALLAPRSLALIGASAKPHSVGGVVAQNLRSAGFAGPIHFVNPRGGEIAGVKCYADVAALPAAPDLAVIATPPDTVPELE